MPAEPTLHFRDDRVPQAAGAGRRRWCRRWAGQGQRESAASPASRSPAAAASRWRSARLARGRGQRLREGVIGLRADHLRAVDEEGRRRIDAILVLRHQPLGDDAVRRLLVAHALVELFGPDAAEAGDALQRLARIAGGRPIRLALEKRVDEGVEAVGRGAASEYRRAQRHLVERVVAKDQLGLAGVDPVGLDLGQGFGVELGAVRTSERGVFEDRNRRVGLPEDPIVAARHSAPRPRRRPPRGSGAAQTQALPPATISYASPFSDPPNVDAKASSPAMQGRRFAGTARACGSPFRRADHRLAQGAQRLAKRGILDCGEAAVKRLALLRGERPRRRRTRGGAGRAGGPCTRARRATAR